MNNPTRITLSFERKQPGEGMEASYYAVIRWDGSQEVWYIESTNIPKLQTEAKSTAELREKIRSYIADL